MTASYLTDDDAWLCVCSRRLLEIDASLGTLADSIAAELAGTPPFRAVTPITAAEAWATQRSLDAAAP